MLKEFKEFALSGSLIDFAVAFIMGAAFSPIVTSLVNDIIMPPIGLIFGADFSNLFAVIDGSGSYGTLAAAQEAGAVTLNWGLFLITIINFLIIAFVMFMLVRSINRMKAEAPEAPPEPPADEVLLSEIRDLLKAGR